MTAAFFAVIRTRGPLAGTRDALPIVQAQNQQQAEARSAADCWSVKDLLRALRVTLPGS